MRDFSELSEVEIVDFFENLDNEIELALDHVLSAFLEREISYYETIYRIIRALS